MPNLWNGLAPFGRAPATDRDSAHTSPATRPDLPRGVKCRPDRDHRPVESSGQRIGCGAGASTAVIGMATGLIGLGAITAFIASRRPCASSAAPLWRHWLVH